jgi:predicted ferric reductase
VCSSDLPFSISSSPVHAQGRLGFTIKELGDFTRTLGTVKVGEHAYVDGPYGAFSIDRVSSPQGFVFVAGGIGIAPMLSMLSALADRSDKRTHRLFFACRNQTRLTGREEIEVLKGRLSLEVIYVLEEALDGWTGAQGRITRELLDKHLPAARGELCYFICGPKLMIHAAEKDLGALGVPARRVHSELFDLV